MQQATVQPNSIDACQTCLNVELYGCAVQALHLVMKGSLDLMSVGVGKEKRKKDTVAENTTSERPDTNQKELGDVK